jgi:hypothetical protein
MRFCMSTLTLFPGFKQVEAFDNDGQYEEEEVVYVTLDLGSIEPTLVPSMSEYRLIVSVLEQDSHPIFATRRHHF